VNEEAAYGLPLLAKAARSSSARAGLHTAATCAAPPQPGAGAWCASERTPQPSAQPARIATAIAALRQRFETRRPRSSAAPSARMEGKRERGSAASPRVTIARSHDGTRRTRDGVIVADASGRSPSSPSCSATQKLY
jgi:hypothetical protein